MANRDIIKGTLTQHSTIILPIINVESSTIQYASILVGRPVLIFCIIKGGNWCVTGPYESICKGS